MTEKNRNPLSPTSRTRAPWIVALAAMLIAPLSALKTYILAAGPGIFGGSTVLGDLLILFAIFAFIVGLVVLYALKGAARHGAIGAFVVALALLIIGLLYNAANPLSTTPSIAPSSATTSSYIVSSGLQTGCSLNSITNTETCLGTFNTNSTAAAGGGYYLTSTNGTHFAAYNNWITFSIHSSRADALNATYGFTDTIASVETITTTGSSPVTYSPLLGYTLANSQSNGVWKVFPSTGSAANLNPTASAPSVTTSIQSTVVGIAAFGSVTETYHISLPGSNSTYLPPFALGAVNTIYQEYSFVVTTSNPASGTPTTFTLLFEPVFSNS